METKKHESETSATACLHEYNIMFPQNVLFLKPRLCVEPDDPLYPFEYEACNAEGTSVLLVADDESLSRCRMTIFAMVVQNGYIPYSVH